MSTCNNATHIGHVSYYGPVRTNVNKHLLFHEYDSTVTNASTVEEFKKTEDYRRCVRHIINRMVAKTGKDIFEEYINVWIDDKYDDAPLKSDCNSYVYDGIVIIERFDNSDRKHPRTEYRNMSNSPIITPVIKDKEFDASNCILTELKRHRLDEFDTPHQQSMKFYIDPERIHVKKSLALIYTKNYATVIQPNKIGNGFTTARNFMHFDLNPIAGIVTVVPLDVRSLEASKFNVNPLSVIRTEEAQRLISNNIAMTCGYKDTKCYPVIDPEYIHVLNNKSLVEYITTEHVEFHDDNEEDDFPHFNR